MSGPYSEDLLEKYYKLREERKKAREAAKLKAKQEQPKEAPREGRPPRERIPGEELRKREERYWLPLEHQIVTIKLITGEELTGKLHLNLWARYDVKLELNNGEEILIPKHSILYVKGPRKLE